MLAVMPLQAERVPLTALKLLFFKAYCQVNFIALHRQCYPYGRVSGRKRSAVFFLKNIYIELLKFRDRHPSIFSQKKRGALL